MEQDRFSNTLTMIIVVITLLLLALMAMPRKQAEATPELIQQMEQADACGIYVQKALEQEWQRQKNLKGGE